MDISINYEEILAVQLIVVSWSEMISLKGQQEIISGNNNTQMLVAMLKICMKMNIPYDQNITSTIIIAIPHSNIIIQYTRWLIVE